MAKKRPKPKPQPKIPRTGAEKEANVQLTIARQLGVSQTQARQAATSRGAFRSRKLRAGGDMSRYNLGRFKDDPFPTIPSGPGGGAGPTQTAGPSGTGTGARRSPKPAKPKKGTIAGKRGMQERGEIKPKGAPKKPPSTTSNQQNMDAAERKAAYLAEQARKKAEAAKKKVATKETTAKARGNTAVAL